MNRNDWAMWRAARTAAELGELTALWVERTVLEHPGYEGPEGPDPETAEIAALLAGLNRRGFVTTQSQPGCAETGTDARRWEQRAAVEGFAFDAALEVLSRVADEHGLRIIVHKVDMRWFPRRRTRDRATVVTRVNGRAYTAFGAGMSRRFLRSGLSPFAGCRREAIDDLCTRRQITIIDLVYGRNTMWPLLLAGFTANEPCKIEHTSKPERTDS